MNKKNTPYEEQIKRLDKQYYNLNIYESDDLTRQFHVVSAGLLNYLPQIPYQRHEEIFKNILLHQKLSIIEQDAINLINNIQVKNFTTHTVRLLKSSPAIICTFHTGSYRLINLLLAQYGIPFSLVISQKVLQEQGNMFRKIFSSLSSENSDDFNLINAEFSSSALQMFRELKKGKSIVIYMDGNTGAGTQTNQNENSCLISFLDQQIMARKGVGFLSHAARVPVIPVICSRDPIEKITLDFFELMHPDISEDRNVFAEKTTQKIYDIVAPFITKHPEQWEALLYLHKVAKIVKPVMINNVSEHKPLNDKLRFNEKHFGLFKVSENNYILNKTNYLSYPIDGSIHSLLEKSRHEPVNTDGIDVNLLYELSKNHVLIHA